MSGNRFANEAKKRKPRKKGQKRKSSKHSDLYTDEDPRGTIHGLGFKDAATARKGIAIINKAKRTHAHKVQATLVMVQRGKVAIKRTKDPEKKKNLKAANKLWSAHLDKLKEKTKQMNESALREVIKSVINENFAMRDGKLVELGSEAHIAELQRELDELAFIRDRYSRTSKQRERMTRAMGVVREELKKAKRLSKLLQDGDT